MKISYPKIRQMCRSHPKLMARILNKMKRKSLRHWQKLCIENEMEAGRIIIRYLYDNNIDKDIL